jgi:hypothetical protein
MVGEGGDAQPVQARRQALEAYLDAGDSRRARQEGEVPSGEQDDGRRRPPQRKHSPEYRVYGGRLCLR